MNGRPAKKDKAHERPRHQVTWYKTEGGCRQEVVDIPCGIQIHHIIAQRRPTNRTHIVIFIKICVCPSLLTPPQFIYLSWTSNEAPFLPIPFQSPRLDEYSIFISTHLLAWEEGHRRGNISSKFWFNWSVTFLSVTYSNSRNDQDPNTPGRFWKNPPHPLQPKMWNGGGR